jgi:hypothetical protein
MDEKNSEIVVYLSRCGENLANPKRATPGCKRKPHSYWHFGGGLEMRGMHFRRDDLAILRR